MSKELLEALEQIGRGRNIDRKLLVKALEFAINYLESVEENAIIFTQGDNDTYPLWYAQEVEGIRNDVRDVNLSLLGVDWYIDQLHNKANKAMPVKLQHTKEDYLGDRRNQVRYYKTKKDKGNFSSSQ